MSALRVHNPLSPPLYIDIKRIINHLNFYQYEKFSYHANREQRENDLGEFAEEATIIEETATPKRVNHFIEANTQEVTLNHLKNDCITPVFAKDNELTVNHAAFIETVWEAANSYYNGETIGTPDIRVSHVIKGRTPDAIHKPANQLLESDKLSIMKGQLSALTFLQSMKRLRETS